MATRKRRREPTRLELLAAAVEREVRADERAVQRGRRSRRPGPGQEALDTAVAQLLPHLPAGHPVEGPARQMCREFGHLPPIPGGVCGRCWAAAIRADERVVVWFNITAKDTKPDPAYLDEIAIERAMRGEPVPLTHRERVEVARRLRLGGYKPSAIADRLRMRLSMVRVLLADLPAEGSSNRPAAAVVPALRGAVA